MKRLPKLFVALALLVFALSGLGRVAFQLWLQTHGARELEWREVAYAHGSPAEEGDFLNFEGYGPMASVSWSFGGLLDYRSTTFDPDAFSGNPWSRLINFDEDPEPEFFVYQPQEHEATVAAQRFKAGCWVVDFDGDTVRLISLPLAYAMLEHDADVLTLGFSLLFLVWLAHRQIERVEGRHPFLWLITRSLLFNSSR